MVNEESDGLLDPPTEEDWQRLVQHYNTTRERIAQDVALLKEWFAQQPHLPQTGHGDLMFQSYLIRSEMSVERAKVALDSFFTVKTLIPEFFTGRDPLSPELLASASIAQFFVSRRLTKEGDRICLVRLTDPDPKKFHPENLARIAMMIGELFHTKLEDIMDGSILVVDCVHAHIGHMMHMSLTLAKKLEICRSKGHQFRMKSVHLLNAPPFFDVLLAIARKIMPAYMHDLAYFHYSLESLHQHTAPEYLPLDYGGTQQSMQESTAAWKKEIERHREWYMEKEAVEIVDESKRPGKPFDVNALFGMEGTFRQLTVD